MVRALVTGSSDDRSLIPVFWNGGVAQLGERLLCKQEVIGSNPFTSTTGVWRRLTDTVRGNPGGALFEG